MSHDVVTLTLPLSLGLGTVNCYLVPIPAGHVLIDTGGSNARQALRHRLAREGCTPGSLKLVVLTHGDFDHTGNAAYLRAVFGARIAMHPDDAGMAERADMFVNRKTRNALIKALAPLFTGFGASERFSPDILLDEGSDLSPYGVDARIISLPGHSRGSIGILTVHGDLFCGDFLNNSKEPTLNKLIDDAVAAHASLAKLRSLGISTVYPGHGRPFAFALLQT